MSFITELIEKFKENILLSIIVCFFLLGGIGIGGYYFFSHSSDDIAQKENNEYELIVFDDQEERDEQIINNEKNKEKIKPTFLLKHSDISIVIQMIIEGLICSLFSLNFLNIVEKINDVFSKIKFYRQGFLLILFCFIEFILHSIINFILSLIAQFTSGNGYGYLLKNYWKSHFNNLGSCLIFIFLLFLISIISMYMVHLAATTK